MDKNFLVGNHQDLIFRKFVDINPYLNLMHYYSSVYFYEGFKGINNLPSHVKKLYIYDNFNEPIDFLPVSLEELKLGEKFNKEIKNLPPSLKKLELGRDFKQELTLPLNLEELSVYQITQEELNNLPKSLRKLEIKEIKENLLIPEQVEILHIYHHLITKIKNRIYDYFNFNCLLKPFEKSNKCSLFEVSTDLSRKNKAVENLSPEIYFRMKEGDVITNSSRTVYYLVLEKFGKKKLVKHNHEKFITFDKFSLYYWKNIYEHISLYINRAKVFNSFEEEEFIGFEWGYLINIRYKQNNFWVFLENEYSKENFIKSINLKVNHLIFTDFEKKGDILKKFPEIDQICSIKYQFNV